MKNFLFLLITFGIVMSCTTNKTIASADKKAAINDTVRIANDSLEYEVIVTDPGFGSWLASRAYPRDYHSQSYLENKNRMYVIEYNVRVSQPQRYGNLYEWRIDYDQNIDYGYEVNYLMYNYFIFFQNKYNQKLGGFVPDR